MSEPVSQCTYFCFCSMAYTGSQGLRQREPVRASAASWLKLAHTGSYRVSQLKALFFNNKTATGSLARDFQTPSHPLSMSNVNYRIVKL